MNKRRIAKIEGLVNRLSRATDNTLDPDPVAWAMDTFNFEADNWQSDVLRSEADRLLLNCSRQSGKSTTASLLALYTALKQPGVLILLVSPSLRQSSELFRKFRDWFDLLDNKPRLTEDNKLSVTFDTGTRVVSLPGSESTIRGFSAVDLLIEDEASRVVDDLFFSTRPMLAISKGRHILMSTPWGKRGHFWDCWQSGEWEKVKVTAYDCPRISNEFLEQEQGLLGSYWFKQEYLCEFLDSQNALFTFDLIAKSRKEVRQWSL